ncbi:MAG TPA: type II secretion system F family protein [Thermomicrobiaceae bacterium]|nr:type II secretion system F family protein [Thermomicrobiaceae bacterium]
MVSLIVILILVAGVMLAYGLANRRERVATPELEERLGRFGSYDLASTDAAAAARTPSALAQQVDRVVQGKSFTENIGALIARADLRMTVGEFLIMRAATTGGGFVIGFILGHGFTNPVFGVLVGVVAAFVGWMLPQWYVSRRARQRMQRFVNQLGDTVVLMANSLRAGYSLLQTMEMVSRESPAPMSEEFRRVVREVGLGISAQDAMAHLLRRIPSEDLDLLVTAINIQHEVGGNLAQILDVIGETIRERVRIKGEVRVLTSQQSMSGYVISALPVGLAALLFVINPSYEMGMMKYPWICMPIAGVTLMVAGFFAMRKIVQIDV